MSDEDSGPEAKINELVPGQEEFKLPGALEALKGDNPLIMGIDYYKVIYMSAAFLCLIMLFLYTVIEDKAVGQMVLIQGFFSFGLLITSYWFRTRMQ